MFKGVIFDLDGTLIDTIDDLADSMNSVLKNSGYPTHEISKYKYFVGNGMRNLVERTIPADCRSEDNISRCLNEMISEYARHWADKSCPYEGIGELLKELTARGIKMAVLSNKRHNFTVDIIEKLLPDYKFEIVYGEREGTPRKPDPAGALEISSQIGIPPSQILYLGDTSTDMQTATAAGMYAVGVLWGFREAEELLEHGAKVLISEPLALLKLID